MHNSVCYSCSIIFHDMKSKESFNPQFIMDHKIKQTKIKDQIKDFLLEEEVEED
jgi:hypothetical protein